MAPVYLSSPISGRDNNVHLIRHLTAAGVLISHTFLFAVGEILLIIPGRSEKRLCSPGHDPRLCKFCGKIATSVAMGRYTDIAVMKRMVGVV